MTKVPRMLRRRSRQETAARAAVRSQKL